MTIWTDKTIPVKHEIPNKKPKTKQHIGLHEKQERYQVFRKVLCRVFTS
jgi:hypothetical protein